MCHRGVRIIANQPEETLVGEEADFLPFGTRHIATARVEVAQQQDVLSSKCNASVLSHSQLTYSILLRSGFCEWWLVFARCVKKDIHVCIPAAADIGYHVVEGVDFLHSAVRRGVLGNQDKVAHGYKTNYGEKNGAIKCI